MLSDLTTSQLESIVDHFELTPEYFVASLHKPDYSKSDFGMEQFDLVEPKPIALMQYDNSFNYTDADTIISAGDYLVITFDEVSDLMKDYADDQLYEALDHIPDHLNRYFNDTEFWDDMYNSDCGEVLSYTDGSEYEEVVDGTSYFIYNRS